MADQKLSQLTETTMPTAADYTYVVKGGVSKKVALGNVLQKAGTGTTTSPVIQLADTVGTEELTNPGFETWADGSPTGWLEFDPGGSNGTATQENSIKHSGASSLKITCGADGSKIKYQVIAGLTPGATRRVQIWGYKPTGGADPKFLAFNGTFGDDATHMWLATTPTIGSWEEIPGGDPSAATIAICDGVDAWELLEIYITVPASGKIAYYLPPSGDEGDECYYDDSSLKPFIEADSETLFSETNSTDSANVKPTTVLKETVLEDGGFVVDRIMGNGMRQTDLDAFEYEKPVEMPKLVANAVETSPTTSIIGTVLNDGGGAGASMTLTADSTNMAGEITFLAGNGIPGSGKLGTLIFGVDYDSAPKAVLLTLGNAPSLMNTFYVPIKGVSEFEIHCQDGIGAGNTIRLNYLVIQ